MAKQKYDFCGWATRTNILCTDGRTIMENAFKECNGKTVPLVWGHMYDGPDRVLGHALLENRQGGVYAYGLFNSTETGQNAKMLVEHGDVTSLSIQANRLKQNKSGEVFHGKINEVSLVLAGANPEAFIETVGIEHGESDGETAIIWTSEEGSIKMGDVFKEDSIAHADEKKSEETESEQKDSEETVGDIIDSMNEKQKNVMYMLIAEAMENGEEDDDEEEIKQGDDLEMKYNVFYNDEAGAANDTVLSHADQMEILNDAKRCGSLKEAVLSHGIDEIETLFPEPKTMNNSPDWVSRNMDWVSVVMGGVHHVPFSRIKSMFADITEEDARAKGYVKGNFKKEEVFGLLKRSTTPTTVYKKQKLHRDDVIDITDFDVVAWLKSEMRMMLNEELARAFLIGDGRDNANDDKINPLNIRPIINDDDFYTIKTAVVSPDSDSSDVRAKKIIRAAVKARKDYKGSGRPMLFTTEDILTDLLLLEDNNGRIIYDSEEKLASAMRVSKIVTVPVLEGAKNDDGKSYIGVIVNLNDYTVGGDRGGEVNMFDDFDIDYNAQKYLIETRCSGALTKPYSAIALYLENA